ncbi:MAG: hypothetical protein ACYDEY_08055 [Acidimicrobiales bacterium]
MTVGRKHRKNYGLLAGAAALVTVPSPIGTAIASAHKPGVARTSVASQMKPASVHSRPMAGVSPLVPPTLAPADTFVNQGQAAATATVVVAFWECQDVDSSPPTCPLGYDQFQMNAGVAWQEWKASLWGTPYYLLTQDGWWGDMPDKPSTQGWLDDDLISVLGFYSDHRDGSAFIAQAVPDWGNINDNCYVFTSQAEPPPNPCKSSSPDYNGHHYADTVVHAYEWVQSTTGSTPYGAPGGEVTVLNGNP